MLRMSSECSCICMRKSKSLVFLLVGHFRDSSGVGCYKLPDWGKYGERLFVCVVRHQTYYYNLLACAVECASLGAKAMGTPDHINSQSREDWSYDCLGTGKKELDL